MSLENQLNQLSTNTSFHTTNELADSLPLRIALIIRHRIMHDIMHPSTPIRERRLAEELEVSRTPLRDALKILALEKLVEITPNRGAVVVENSLDDISDMLLVYCELDGFAGALACRIATESNFLTIERHLRQMEIATENDDRVSYFNANQAFHLAIVASSKSKSAIEFHKNLSIRLHRVRYLSILQNDQWTDRHEDHADMLTALRNRDVEGFSKIQKEHFSVAWRYIDRWANRSQ